eukprot:jgi/Botrbrau1/14453/Bobra.0014s0097.2
MLRGKIAIVTGASRGIGRAISERFASEGASLILTATSEDSLKEVIDSLRKSNGSGNYETYGLDLTDREALDKFVEELLQRHQAIDILVNNAGMGPSSHPLQGDPNYLDRIIHLNVLAPMRLCHHLGRHFEKRGSGAIINIDSVAGIDASGPQAGYVASKHAMTGWTESLAEVMKDKGVKVTAIMPAYVRSDMTKSDTMDPEAMIHPEDIAEAALLLFRLSDNAVPTAIVVRNARNVKKT